MMSAEIEQISSCFDLFGIKFHAFLGVIVMVMMGMSGDLSREIVHLLKGGDISCGILG